MRQASLKKHQPSLDLDALLCALVLVPESLSRNRFFALYERPEARRVRRRAARVRSIVRQLIGRGRPRAELVGEQVLDDGQVILRYRIDELAYERTAALTALEAAALRYALHQAGVGVLTEDDRDRVEHALERLARERSPSSGRPRLE